MMGQTHAFVSMIPAVLIFWKIDGGRELNHGRFVLFAFFSGMLVDFDMLAGMLEQVYTGAIPGTFCEFFAIGRRTHPIFTHHFITFSIAAVAFIIGILFWTKTKRASNMKSKQAAVATIITICVTVIPTLLLRLPTRPSYWQVVDDATWRYNLAITTLFLSGLAVSVMVNIKRPLHLMVFGLGIMLHLSCDIIEYWVLILGPFDPAWLSSEEPARIILELYDFDRNLILGALFEAPPHLFFLGYIAWYSIKGRNMIVTECASSDRMPITKSHD
ncbi:hypothetical protein GF325_17615 [Candidatus Bathyarchaeota archaeon]|nr:hypothetical protein [Candidatus Bathyarchaeota archaeon]